ncbi:tyrosine-type recombinase/integrase [Paludibacterium sp. dN 18-1]|uniref:Tyrosine-type recombinase/integrase n=2 Tax=Paludibacterium denitrificans TaxID=2675226 RepID=A0A844GBJ5_9NEIS|nr:tyrosine-type recombinase/integrase [Paludibacterium denitrificans]
MARQGLLIDAKSDQQAVLTWLSEFLNSPRTLASYRKESERFLMWLDERQQRLSSVRREDVLEFERFLAHPTPQKKWLGPSKPRQHPDWKPFSKPLTASSIRQSLTILGALFSYLNNAGYLNGNPFKLRRSPSPRTMTNQVEHFLSEAARHQLQSTLAELPRHTTREKQHAERADWLFSLLYLTGARRSEVANACMGDLFERQGNWWWRITGKGGVSANVPVSDELLGKLKRYRLSLDLGALPISGETTPLVCRLPGKNRQQALQPLTDKAIYLICQEIFARASTNSSNPALRRELEQATPHWMRHTAASHQLEAGVPLLVVSQNLRHASIQTTRRYLHTEDDARHAASRRHTLRNTTSQDDPPPD